MDTKSLAEGKPHLHECNYLQCPQDLNRKLIAPMPYFLYVHKGTGVFILGSKEYRCQAGDLFYCPYGVSNTIIADPDDPFLLSGLDFEFEEGKPDYCPGITFREHRNIQGSVQLQWMLMELVRQKSKIDHRYAEYTDALFKAWLLFVDSLAEDSPGTAIPERVAEYLASHIREDLTLEDIARVFPYHPNHLNRIFKNRYGMTIKAYLGELRAKEAARLLTYSSLTVSEIAVLCGYEDLNYFSRIFKKRMRLTPTLYRRRRF